MVSPAPTPASPTASPVYPQSVSLWQRIKYSIKVRFIKWTVSTVLRVLQLPGIRDSKLSPTFTKSYSCRSSLTNRIFVPTSYKSGDPLLPLYIDIHGGGFVLANPSGDDKFCSRFANKNRVLVVSIDYPKAPENPFPAAVEALTDIVKAILQDEELLVDKTRVAVGGFSAGANLSLAICQDAALQSKIGGIVAYYPPCNWTNTVAEKLATRPEHAPPDLLESMAPMFDWSYFNADQDLRDPQLSVTFATRETLPPKLCIFGCEFDMLCRDAEIMAENFAKVGSGQRQGNDILWEQNGVRWEKVLGEEHGFDITPNPKGDKIRIEKRAQEMWDAAAQWLFREVYV